jgi:hypothetical protein
VVAGGTRKRLGIVGAVARDGGEIKIFIDPNLLAPYLDAYLKSIENWVPMPVVVTEPPPGLSAARPLRNQRKDFG